MQELAGNMSESELGITTVELGKCLLRIPGNSIIVLCCSGGFSTALRLEISTLHTGRELFLLED